ncbi:MAG: tetratricopeptide repeat protein, partial [Chloroflexi bacterium]|nr:tetratricopeptide repeat protein [Chloroflexota bacterium]
MRLPPSRPLRVASALPELWVVAALSLILAVVRALVPAELKGSLGWELQPYQIFAVFVALAQFILPGAMLVRLMRIGGSWWTRLPTYFAAAVGVWSLPGLVVAASASLNLQVLVYSGRAFTVLIALAALVREWRSPAMPDDAQEEGRTDLGKRLNVGLAALGLLALVAVTYISFTAPVALDDNLQLGYVQDDMVVPHINQSEPFFGAGIRPNTRGSLTTWPVNLALLAQFAGLPAQQAFWLLRTLLALLNVLAVYTLALRLFGKRNQALASVLLYVLMAFMLTGQQDALGFAFFSRNAQDKFIVRYTLLPVVLAWSLAYLQKPDRRRYWLAGLLTVGQAMTHTTGAVMIGIPLASLGMVHVVAHFQGINLRSLFHPRRWRVNLRPGAIGGGLRNLAALNWPVLRPYLYLSVWSLLGLILPAVQQALPDAPVVAYSLTDTRDPTLWFRINLVISNYRLLISDNLGPRAYIVHPAQFLSADILLPAFALPLFWWKAFKKHLPSELIAGIYLFNPFVLLFPPVIQLIGDRATPWLLYRFAWPLSLIGVLTTAWLAWSVIEWLQERLPALRAALPALAVAVTVVAASSPIRYGLLTLSEIRKNPLVVRCRTLQPGLLSRLPELVGDGGVVLSTVDLDLCIPTSAANAYPVEYGLTSTINRFPASRISEGDRRFNDVRAFNVALVVDQSFMDILTRWNVRFIMLRQDQPIVTQLNHLPQLFKQEVSSDRYLIYRVLPASGANILPETPVKDRWKAASWAGDDPLVAANTLWSQGRWDEAIVAYRALAGQDPQMRFPALFGEGLAQQSAGRLEAAILAFQAATGADPQDPQGWLNLGNAYRLNGDYAQMEQAEQRVIDLVSWHPDAWQRLGDALRLSGRDAEAQVAYEYATAADNTPGTTFYYRALGTTYTAVNWLDRAAEAFQRANAIREETSTYFYLAQAYVKQGKFDAALQTADRSQRIDYWSDLPLVTRGVVEVSQQDSPAAAENFRAAALRNPQSLGIQQLATTEGYVRGSQAALQTVENLFGYRLGFSQAVITAGQLQFGLGQIDDALALGQQAWAWQPVNSDAAVLIASVWDALGQTAEATRSYRDAIRANKYDASAYTGLATMAQSQGDWGSAIGWGWSAMSIAPYNSAAATSLGNTYAAHGAASRALAAYQLSAQMDPQNPLPQVQMGNLFLSLGQAQPATGGKSGDGNSLAGQLASSPPVTGDPVASARRAFESAAALETQSSLGLVGLGNLALSLGNLDQAISYLEQAITLTPYTGSALVSLGQAYEQSGQPDRARQALQSALDRDPGYVIGYDVLGKLYLRLAKRDEAEQTYRLVIRRLPWQSTGYVGLGGLLEALGDSTAAISTYQMAASLEPRPAAPALAA